MNRLEFKEEYISQIPALKLLMAMGFQWIEFAQECYAQSAR